MVCPHCGTATTSAGGTCASCHGSLDPDRTRVSTGLLTPFPAGADDVTRLSGAELAAQPAAVPRTAGPVTPAGARASGPLTPGEAFGPRYHTIRLLGAGGMGAVYQAWDDELGMAVAIKVIRPEITEDPTAAADIERRFKQELLFARKVTHKNVVRIHDIGEIDGIKYITMPYIHGQDVASMLRKAGRLPVPAALAIARQVVAGLRAAHDEGIVHRDLKPANIMMEDDHVTIMDFGIARSVAGGGGTRHGAVVGTLDYMAPEQARAQPVDQRADIYAFGLIFYDMLLGPRRASEGESAVAQLMQRMQQAPPAPRTIDPSIPEPVDRIIMRSLQIDPAARYQSAAELAADLDALDANGFPLAGKRIAGRPRWRSPKALGAAAAVVLLIGTGGYAVSSRLSAPAASTAPAGQPISLTILPFRNASGDPSLDWLGASFAELLRTELGQSSRFRAVSSDRVHQILTNLRIAPDASFDPPTLRRLAEFSNAQTILWGQYVKFGPEVHFNVTLQDIAGQRAIPLTARAAGEPALLTAVSDLAQTIRERLALAPDTIKELQASAFKPSSRSVQALRHFNEGLALVRTGQNSEALKRFEAATTEDADFALAYSRLALTHAALGYSEEAERFSRIATEGAGSLPPRERYIIEANHARVLNDNVKAIAAYENLARVTPGDVDVRAALGALYEQTGAFDKAHEQLSAVLAADPKNLEALILMGRIEVRRRNWEGALNHLTPALNLATQLDNDEARASTLNAIGVVYKRLNRPEEALRHYRDALEIKQRIGQKGSIAITLNEMGQVHTRLGQPGEAQKNYDEALRLRREIGDKRGIATTLLDLGTFYSELGKYDDALANYKESLPIHRELGNANLEALCLNNIGNMYLRKGQYQDALTYFQQALVLRERLTVAPDTALTLHNLALTSARMSDYDGALAYHLRALDLWRNAGDRREAAMESYRMAEIFEYQGRYGAALKSNEEALNALRGVNERGNYLADVLSGYGHTLALAGRFEEADAHLAQAAALARELQMKGILAQTASYQAAAFYYRGELKAAREAAEGAQKLARETGERASAMRARLVLARIAVIERPQAAIAEARALMRDAQTTGFEFVQLDAALACAEALHARKAHQEARTQLEPVLSRAERLGLKLLMAKAHAQLGALRRDLGQSAEAERHVSRASRMASEIAAETGGTTLQKRADLRILFAAPAGAAR